MIVSLLWVTSVLSAGSVESVVAGAVILDDADPLSRLTSMESAGLGDTDLDIPDCLALLTFIESAAVLDTVEPLV